LWGDGRCAEGGSKVFVLAAEGAVHAATGEVHDVGGDEVGFFTKMEHVTVNMNGVGEPAATAFASGAIDSAAEFAEPTRRGKLLRAGETLRPLRGADPG